MLSSAPKNRRRRRRRHKRSIPASNTTDSNNLELDDDESVDDKFNPTEKNRTFSPKVNSKFINEDVEIETAMLLKHLTQDSEFSLKKERAIEFFTSTVSGAELKRIESVETKDDDQIEIMPSPDDQTATENFPTEGPQLAAFYLNDDLSETLVVPFDIQTYVPLEQQIYLPALTLPKQFPQDVESSGDVIVLRNFIDEGYFEKPKPNISNVNSALFINRLIEESSFQWYDFKKREIKHLFDITVDRRLIKVFCAEKFHPIDYPPTSVCLELDTFSFHDRILKVHLKYIYFDIHPTFNNEQKLAREIESLYDEYVAQKQSDILTKIETKLKILRQLLETVTKSNKGKGQRQANVDNLQVHRDELKELRATWHRESARHRELMKTILEKWAQLKKLREGISEPTTSLKLVIKAHEPDIDKDEYEWSQRYELEHREMMDEAQQMYRQYKATRKKSVKRSIENEDEENLLDVEIAKPNTAKIEQELLDTFAGSVRPPGEQIIDFELEKTSAATIKSPPKYVVRLILDDGQLEFPESTKLNSVGQAQINAIFSIKFTTKIPHQLKFQIFEKTNLTVTRRVAEGLYPTPNETELYLPTAQSGVEFESQGPRKYLGKIICCIGWAATDLESEPMSARGTAKSAIKAASTSIQGTVDQWFSDQLIDPMDPENSALATAMEKSHSTTANIAKSPNKQNEQPRKNLFRLNEDTYAFCDRDKLNDNKRIELLNARFNSDLKLKDCKLVPHNEVEIEIPMDLQIFEDMLWVDPIDVQRYQGKKYLKHVYDIITNHCEVINRNYEHRDLLIGDTPPTLYGALEAFSNIFSPRRPLNPHRKTLIRKSNFHEDRINRFNIIINVVRASGIPFRNVNDVTVNINRRTSQPTFSLGSTMQNFHRNANVRPFVTATFRDKTLRTSTVDGSNPTWNEQIVIPINEGINQIKDSLWFHMYDEIIEDLPSNDNMMTPTSEIYQKISTHYLGELLIPFSTIYASQRIEGTFEMSTPLILVGYTKPAVNLPELGTDSNGGLIETRQSILISILISIEPIIEITHFATSHLECVELRAIKNRIGLWLSEITDEFPERAQDPLVSLANGKRVCITRLVGAIDIPFERNETSEYMIRRFVSLIPVRPHKNVCTKLNGVWLTNDQILNILIASPKDLGVLLTCFYLSLGFNAYLVMGFAIPYGDTTFVLTKENGEYFLIDPHSGRKCSSRDTFCALMKVYCIVSPKNVWANIQREERVFMQNFDTTQTAEWRELFTKSTQAPTDLVHELTLAYTDSLDCSNLKKSIETKIMKKFKTWRLERKTIWNKKFIEVMQEILNELEQDQCFGVEQKTYTNKLIECTQSKYKINGYPMNMPYVGISKIIERIKATEIYLNTDPKVEFSLAVHIQSYPMNIFSVWIFILSLIPIV